MIEFLSYLLNGLKASRFQIRIRKGVYQKASQKIETFGNLRIFIKYVKHIIQLKLSLLKPKNGKFFGFDTPPATWLLGI